MFDLLSPFFSCDFLISFPFSFEVTLKQEVKVATFYQETGTSMWKISPRLHPGGGLEP